MKWQGAFVGLPSHIHLSLQFELLYSLSSLHFEVEKPVGNYPEFYVFFSKCRLMANCTNFDDFVCLVPHPAVGRKLRFFALYSRCELEEEASKALKKSYNI